MTGILSAFVGGTYSSAPVNNVAPVVTGTTTVGQTLSCTTGTWTGVPTPTFTYQWFRSPSTSISGATSSSYTLVVADLSNTIFCTVTATNSVAAVGANSNTTASIAAGVPSAPTIGTATATSSSTATVAFTQPSSNGGATITSYTATSSPGGITGTLSQAGSGTITVSGLTVNTAYTFTVFATNSVGNSAASGSSNSVTPVIAIGDAYGGGYYAGQISTSGNGVANFNLVVGPRSTAENTSKQWKTSNSGSDPTSVIDGPGNSTTMNSSTYPAAQFCKGLTIGGYSDWYMPAKNELEVCYYNLKPNANDNVTNSGANTNAVPSRSSNYTAGTPAQTAATIFQEDQSQAFNPNFVYYWSSTQYDTERGWRQYFSNGNQYPPYKTTSHRVRAIRRVAV